MKKMDKFNTLELFIYKDEKFRWVFDDQEFGLAQEAFVAGMDDVIDLLTRDFPNHGYDGFRLFMRDMAGSDSYTFISLDHVESMIHPILGQSNYYFCKELKKKVWLCNNLYRYISNTPQSICLWAIPHKSQDS